MSNAPSTITFTEGTMQKVTTTVIAAFVCLAGVGCGEDDPLANCPIPQNADAVEPNLMGDCSGIGTESVVVDSFEELGGSLQNCGTAETQIRSLMEANPEQRLALAVYTNNNSCEVRPEYARGYETSDGFLVTHVTYDASNGCEMACSALGGSWYAFLVDLGKDVDFCGGVTGGC